MTVVYTQQGCYKLEVGRAVDLWPGEKRAHVRGPGSSYLSDSETGPWELSPEKGSEDT